MSYKTFKKLLGETSLERKCRFLFGSGLLLLITASFYLYGRLTADLVDKQNRINGRLSTVPSSCSSTGSTAKKTPTFASNWMTCWVN